MAVDPRDPSAAPSPYSEVGVSGLRHYGGRISEEWLRKLQGTRGMRVYREMDDNDDTLGVVRLLIEMFFRNVEWSTTPWSDDPLHVYQAEYAESLRLDMEHSWADLMSEILTMIPFGFEPIEIVLKRRVGPDEEDPAARSAHTDRLIGIRKLAGRSQETVTRWDIDRDGTVRGMYQQPPNGGGEVRIPYAKLLNFRTTSRRNNPEGRSAYRNCVIAYHRKRDISEYEAIGINRELAGLPVLRVPGKILADNAPVELAGERQRFEEILENLHNDEMAGLLLSSDRDSVTGELLYDISLVTTGGTRTFDTTAIIQRYTAALAQNFLADFVLLGHEQVGSYALSDDKTSTFAVALGGWLAGIAEVLNRELLPLVFRLNGWATDKLPSYVPGDLEKEAVDKLATAIAALTSVGQLTPGDEATENHLRRKLGLPELAESADGIGFRDPGGRDPAAGPDVGGTEIDPEDIKDPQAALNGAQVQALMSIVTAAADGSIPRSSAVELVLAGFPLDRTQAERLIGEAGRGFTPAADRKSVV